MPASGPDIIPSFVLYSSIEGVISKRKLATLK
jgi:hypothetical protein